MQVRIAGMHLEESVNNVLPQLAEWLKAKNVPCPEDKKTFIEDILGGSQDTNESFLKESYNARIRSAKEAVDFICEGLNQQSDQTLKEKFPFIPENTDRIRAVSFIKTYANLQKEAYEKKINTLKPDAIPAEYNAILSSYLTRFTTIFVRFLGLSEKQAKKLLSKADSYVHIKTPRNILATVTPINEALLKESNLEYKKLFLVQMEIPLDPLNDEMVDEYFKVIDDSQKQKPLWYENMSVEGKFCFDQLFKGVTIKEDIRQCVKQLPSTERELLGLANFLCSKMAVVNSEGDILFQRESIRSSITSSRDIVNDEELRLQFAFENLRHIIEVSVQRMLASDSEIHLILEQKDLSENEREIKIQERIKAFFIAKPPIVHQTLITPLFITSLFTPDSRLYYDKGKAIQKAKEEGLKLQITINGKFYGVSLKPPYINLQNTNYIINDIRKFAPTNSGFVMSTDTEMGIHSLVEYYQEKKNVLDGSAELAESHYKGYQNLFGIHSSTFYSIVNSDPKTQKRELMLAAHEDKFASDEHAILFSSCVSGKDREAIKIIFVTALDLFELIYKRAINEDNDEDRVNFNALYSFVFLTQHHQKSAGNNADGANGIKTPKKYLSKDIQQVIESLNVGSLERSNQLAHLNDFKGVMKRYKGTAELEERFVNEFKDHTKQCSELKLKEIIYSSYWNDKACGLSLWKNAPVGITKLRSQFGDKEMQQMAKTRLEIKPKMGTHRYAATTSLYKVIQKKLGNEKSLDDFYAQLITKPKEAVIAIKSSVFSDSRWKKKTSSLFASVLPRGIDQMRRFIKQHPFATDHEILRKFAEICKWRLLIHPSSPAREFYGAIIQLADVLNSPDIHEPTTTKDSEVNQLIGRIEINNAQVDTSKSPPINRHCCI